VGDHLSRSDMVTGGLFPPCGTGDLV
jgi:hypothetical protein